MLYGQPHLASACITARTSSGQTRTTIARPRITMGTPNGGLILAPETELPPVDGIEETR
jgi:hypothetical protein